jgi:hypothetical protein
MENRTCFVGLALFLNLLWSCTTDKKVNSDAVRDEIKSREIKKITEAELVSKVHEIGNAIALSTKKTLGKNLQNAMQNGGVENAIDFCNLNAMPLVDSLSQYFGAEIRRVSIKVRNQLDLPNDLEQELLDAYAYQWKDSLALQANVQALENDTYLFTKPILIDNALCLSCHGSIENGMLKETDDFIKSKYPADSATGYQLGDLRGMWSIVIPKKKVVQSM